MSWPAFQDLLEAKLEVIMNNHARQLDALVDLKRAITDCRDCFAIIEKRLDKIESNLLSANGKIHKVA